MTNKRRRGIFITFEGGDGVGKSSQIKRVAKAFENLGRDVVVTREPGGTAGAEIMRHVILSGKAEEFGPLMEAVLFAAARSDHIEQVIRPALKAGKVVLCDRFYDSTRVYQGVTGKVDLEYLKELEGIAVGEDCVPDLTIVIDLDPEIGLQRASKRRNKDDAPDRFEKEKLSDQKKRRAGFLKIAKEEPERVSVVDGNGVTATVSKRILKLVSERFGLGELA